VITFDDNDVQSLCLCAWKEARGEGTVGMLAVMQVICRRAAIWYGGHEGSIHEAVFGKNQFSSMSVPTDPEFNLEPLDGDASYGFCQGCAVAVIEGTQPDVTGAALYYANLKQVTSGWFVDNIVNNPSEHPQTAVIGRQTFFA